MYYIEVSHVLSFAPISARRELYTRWHAGKVLI